MTAPIIIITAFLGSFLTLFSGFGLGTILMPVVALFFPVPVAVAMTAFVHLLNNLFKLALLWRHIHWPVIIHFGLPAMLAAMPGAWLLGRLSEWPQIYSYEISGIAADITPVKLAVGILLIVFATLEWLPVLKSMRWPKHALPLGGLFSGFFGGLSGHQGAFRSAVLIRAGLDKNQFVACNAAIASMVDITRLIVYGLNLSLLMAHANKGLLAAATIAAFLGVMSGTLGLKKITIGFIQKLVAVMLYGLGLLLVAGLI